MRYILALVFLVAANVVMGQTKFATMDKSPMDMSYFPVGYPLLKMQNKNLEAPIARVIYSRPQKNGRNVFGELIEYGKVWRCGANEATEIEFFTNVKLGNTKVKKGRYALFCVPYTDKWTIILNKDLDMWGSFTYDVKKDVARIDVPIVKAADALDVFSMVFEKTAKGMDLIIGWDSIRLNVPFSL